MKKKLENFTVRLCGNLQAFYISMADTCKIKFAECGKGFKTGTNGTYKKTQKPLPNDNLTK